MKSVLQDWVMELPLRAQGTLLTGIRGCDVAPKPPAQQRATDMRGATGVRMDDTPPPSEPAERQLVAFLRYCVLNPADVREVDVPGSFFQSTAPKNWKPSQLGHYPQHWYAHLMHCFEVVGHLCPDASKAWPAFDIYERMVNNLHLKMETEEEMMERLTEDRIATGTVVS